MRGRAATRAAGDRGETLIELILSIVILGICVTAIGAGLSLSVKISTVHRDQATASAFLHNYAESLQGSYVPCATGTTYSSLLTAPSSFQPPIASVKFWVKDATPPSFSATVCPAADPGLQQVTLRLNSSDGLVTESLVVVLRAES